jgi:CubicO group peptidase (beta-lactamase class C family)
VFSCSNLAYSLLRNVVARVSGKNFAEQMRQTILEQLGMKDSSFLMT